VFPDVCANNMVFQLWAHLIQTLFQ